MNRIIQFILFFIVFISIFLAINSYSILRILNLLGIKRKPIFYAVILFFAFSYPLTIFLEKGFHNIFTRSLHAISAVSMGVLVFLFFSLLIYELVKYIPSVKPFVAGITILIIVISLTIFSVINGFFLTVKTIDLEMNNLKDNISFVQLSDIHTGSIRNSAYLEKIVEKVNNLNPDFVVITGDLVDGTAKLHDAMFNPINSINSPVYFVTGNHEVYENLSKVIPILEKTKMQVLDNKIINTKGIQLVGVSYSQESNNLKTVLSNLKINSSKPSILLYHVPTEIDVAKENSINLMLSGHTHNGQIFPFTLLVKLVHPKIKGLYDVSGMNLYVSPGTGMWGPPMRLGSSNEITLFNLKSSN